MPKVQLESLIAVVSTQILFQELNDGAEFLVQIMSRRQTRLGRPLPLFSGNLQSSVAPPRARAETVVWGGTR